MLYPQHFIDDLKTRADQKKRTQCYNKEIETLIAVSQISFGEFTMQTEIIEQIIHLPIAERVEIIERISRSVKEDLQEGDVKENSLAERKAAYLRLHGAAKIEERQAIIDSLYGIAAVEGKTPPTDKEIKEDYINYLSEKYK